MMRRKSLSPKTPSRLVGTTLSEILISLLVMSIGVVSLATLFPISVLRTVQATQLTNAANLRYNVESLIGIHPELYSVAQSWRSGTAYSAGQLVTPTPLTALKSPPSVFLCVVAGTSGPTEPQWRFDNVNTIDSSAPGLSPPPPCQWQCILLRNYVIDPLGAILVDPPGGPAPPPNTYRHTANGDFFGNDGTSAVVGTGYWPGVRAFSGFGSIPNDGQANDVATLPDSWLAQGESNQVAYTPGTTTCTLQDLTGNLVTPLPSFGFPQSRVVLYDITGKQSHVRPVAAIGGAAPVQTIDWTGFGGPFPTNFVPTQARVESKERRYTWMLSVRRGYSGVSYMDVVVFFKRPFSPKDEQIFPATFTATTDLGADGLPGIGGVDDDGRNGVDDWGEVGFPGSDDAPRNWVIVQYNSTGDKPFVKKGGFVADADNLRWYRIIDVVDPGPPPSGSLLTPAGYALSKAGLQPAGLNPYPFSAPYIAENQPYPGTTNAIFLRVEGQIEQSGEVPTDTGAPVLPGGGGGTPTNGGIPTGRAILMRGIIDVFPIRTHLTWDD